MGERKYTPETGRKTRQLTLGDIKKGAEFRIAQTISVTHPSDDEFNLRVGDIIKIERISQDGFDISVNGHLKNKGDSPHIPNSDVGDITIAIEEVGQK